MPKTSLPCTSLGISKQWHVPHEWTCLLPPQSHTVEKPSLKAASQRLCFPPRSCIPIKWQSKLQRSSGLFSQACEGEGCWRCEEGSTSGRTWGQHMTSRKNMNRKRKRRKTPMVATLGIETYGGSREKSAALHWGLNPQHLTVGKMLPLALVYSALSGVFKCSSSPHPPV